LNSRIYKHNKGDTPSTKYRRPLILIFHEAYLNKKDALRREKYFKTSKGKTTIKTMLGEYLRELAALDKQNEYKSIKKKILR
jgi:putative endonuclease